MLNQTEARYNSADMNIAYRMSVDEYQKLCPYAEELEENWGKPPGEFLTHSREHRCFCDNHFKEQTMPASWGACVVPGYWLCGWGK